MFDLDKWQEIWSTLAANPVRSIMTGFGVYWGIYMLVILIGAGNALEGGVKKNLDGFASNSCFVYTNVTSVPYKGLRKGRQWNMTNRDMELIKQTATSLEFLSPMLFGGSSAKNITFGRRFASGQVMGVYPSHFQIQTQTVLSGRLFNELDVKNLNKVALIGEGILENLFKNGEDPIGKYIRVNGIYFQVVGVIRANSNIQIGGDSETTIHIPFSTMQRAFNVGDNIHFVAATTKPNIPVSILETQIKDILKRSHSIAPSDDKAVRSFNVEKEYQTFTSLFLGVNTIIWIVGIGSLLSGIIGVSNIMLVTVRERTREIGIRRALGAKPIVILTQIVSESFVLTFIAGFGGLFLGVVCLEAISMAMDGMDTKNIFFVQPYISFNVALVSMLILVFSGLLSGVIPALRALSIKAIDAIRDE